MIHDNQLAAKVAARNRVNALALQHLPAMLKALEPFVGKPVCNVTGLLKDKVKKVLPVFDNTPDFQVFYTTGHGYTIRAEFKVCEKYLGRRPEDTFGCYQEESVSLGNLSNGVLTEIYSSHQLSTDFTVDYVRNARKEVDAAKRALSEAQAKLYYFGEYES